MAKISNMLYFLKVIIKHRFKLLNLEVPTILSVMLICGLFAIVAFSFVFHKPNAVDMRRFAPKSALVYLEVNDLGKTLQTIAENEKFKKSSQGGLYFSVVDGLQIGVVITGFETDETRVTNDQSILNLKPQFVAIAETHAWNWQINSLLDNGVNNFVRRVYGEGVRLEKTKRSSETWYMWTAQDGRKTYAVISDTQIFFGNDEDSISKCLLAKSGKIEDLRKNENLSVELEKAKGSMAFGFVSNEGVKKIADVVGISAAVNNSEDENARGFISHVLPQILNKTTKEIVWVARKIEEGIEDKITIKTERDVSGVLSETLAIEKPGKSDVYSFLPPEAFSVTRYNLKSPQIAFRSLLLIVAKSTDPITRKVLGAFSNSILEPYGVSDAETFLSAIGSEILTAQVDGDGEKSLAIVKVKNLMEIRKSISGEIDFKTPPKKQNNAEIWESDDKSLSVALVGEILILGDSKSVYASLLAKEKRGTTKTQNSQLFGKLRQSQATASTFTKDIETSQIIAELFGKSKLSPKDGVSYSLTTTSFNKRGIERISISEFGLIGTILKQFDSE